MPGDTDRLYPPPALVDLAQALLPRRGGQVLQPAELPLDRIREIILHSTDSDDSSPESTARFHTEPVSLGGRGWSRIGYHYYLARSGVAYQTLLPTWDGCHAPPNRHRLGIVLVGRCAGTPTEQQLLILDGLLQWLTARHHLPRAAVLGHREAMPGHTDCPGDAALRWLERWRRAAI